MKNTFVKIALLVVTFVLTLVITGCNTTTPTGNVYNVTFDSNGGSEVASQKVNENDRAQKPVSPTKDGYLFVKWTLNGEEYDFTQPVMGHMTLVASWIEITAGEKATITISTSKDKLERNETLEITVTVENTENKEYVLSVDDETLAAINGNTLSVLRDVTLDSLVKITATLVEDPTVTASKSIIIKAPHQDGRVGELTSDMLKEIGNASVTVSGVLTDIYKDFNLSSNNSTNKYDFLVKMSEGSWYGEWNHQLEPDNKVADQYQMSEKDGYKDTYGNVGHALERVYINKDNQVASKIEKNYESIPAVWEAQHYWNHLGNLQISKFTYDPENQVYQYNIDFSSEEDLYLMTYLSYSLTPMLSDTLAGLYLVVENGAITKIIAQTEILYYGDDPENPSAMSYTSLEFVLSNLGNTVVEDPKPYATPEHADLLVSAFEKMQNATNYTYHTVDTQTSAPSTDGGDYEIQGLSRATTNHATRLAAFTEEDEKIRDFLSAAGTVGTWGWVTENAILKARTGKYSFSSDGNDYFTNYLGYKQIDENTYDEFKYDSKLDTLAGQRQHKGNISENLPKFDLSANIFSFSGNTTKNGVKLYTFTLNETSITRDVAMELVDSYYSGDAESSVAQSFKVVVDENGNLVSVTFPYNLVEGTYLGYYTTTYSEVGTTTLSATAFDGYQARVVATDWADYTTKYYSPTCSTLNTREENTLVVFEDAFGDKASSIPSPTVFLDAFGDNLNGPFFDWREKSTDAEGNKTYIKYVSITASSDTYDENMRITNYDEIKEILDEKLTNAGFVYSPANSDISGGASGKSDRVLCYMNEDITIVIENNYTRYFWIYIYQTGDWSLKR